MHRHFLTLVALVILGWQVPHPAAAQEKASTAKLGQRVGNLSFQDEAAKKHTLADMKGAKASVIVFLSFECPVSNSYCQPLTELAKEFADRGVRVVGLTVNEDETAAQVAKQAKAYRLSFPVFRDDKLTAAHALAADVTPECFVLDADLVLRYRGRIDDAYSARLKKHAGEERRQDLRIALEELTTGRVVREAATLPIGCSIQREPKAAGSGDVTYYRDVAPILQNHCQGCHRPGEVGPFSLMNYRQAANWAADIKSYTQKRLMPPWKPSEGPAFHNERRLSDKQLATLATWADNGAPAGDAKDAPPPRKFPEGWQRGTPDLVLTLDEDFTLGPTGRDLFRCFVLPTNLPEDHYVAAVEVRPTNPRVVHHVLLFLDTSGQGRKLQERAQGEEKAKAKEATEPRLDVGPGYSMAMGVGFLPTGGMGGWAPGQVAHVLPEGSGYPLPKGADVVMQIHFHRNGRVERDRTQIGIYFAKGKVEHPFRGGVLAGGRGAGLSRMFFSIPPGEERFKLEGDSWANGDFTLYTIMPHMHMLGKEIKVTMTPSEGKPRTLIGVKDWDYNWQETYIFKEPVPVKTGTRFHVEAYYDNSAKNPNNPFDPPRRITFGEQTTNEMCFVFFGGVSERTFLRNLPLTPLSPGTKKETK